VQLENMGVQNATVFMKVCWALSDWWSPISRTR